MGCNFSWMFVSNFLMIFYTDVCGIPMAAVSLLMLISRFWDAINDPVIGSLSDRTKTRWGRYRPWLLIGAPLTRAWSSPPKAAIRGRVMILMMLMATMAHTEREVLIWARSSMFWVSAPQRVP